MKPTSADRDDFQPGPHGLWALGLLAATRVRSREEFASAEAATEPADGEVLEVERAEGDEAAAFAGTG
ncbi:MAG: hypothetical protein H7067_04220 [Burkholderiales bacterium]|nr:hypothetical protein [Opitutaceae bacterium]